MSSSYSALSEIPCSKEQVENCIFSRWYPKFKSYVPMTRIIKPLPSEFIRYLEQDGIKLPPVDQELSIYTSDPVGNQANDYSDGEDAQEEEQQEDEIKPLIHFPELHNQIKQVIAELGPVTPKLNWSSPRDAVWILPNNTTKCTEVNEIYLLLNASNYIVHDLEIGQQQGNEFELVLRQWFALNPALEFRVFVRDSKIVGASQRDLNYYKYLESLKDQFKDVFDEFVEETAIPNFPDKSFVLDLYVPRPFNKVYLIDINPFARKTDPLLFSWNELATIENQDDYELRLVPENNVGRFASKEHSENQVPKDVVDASLDPRAIKELTEQWTQLLRRQQEESDSE
ncbi:hypothetical protein ZYGR_0S01580 [Zygosaccharomyces rouxii]|uniref:Translation initiation factor eIF2 assembly protein n=2 Tax=Zygosaccharomyces rouxii TaxID=4956 RepID=C5DXL4_ZYGRC|nr:uncharacterized protein ZYRO0F06006g [Zygosaccharomyces rouxii]KAH9199285.1 D123-domain-containing protein [Zygosaccharomyces rouxii]GAV50024.1 hypothetical protein ZYGR_0S01580 [Zygosaccharomyces rouxii]CAR28525.1 ZYRO0F06006p [Zygosaccharomyces rouxii]